MAQIEQTQQMRTGKGFVAALDQSGGSTPKALRLYGGEEDRYSSEDEMFDLVGVGEHLRMRSLVTESARLTLYQGAEHGELFDLESDPSEMNNLFAKPEGAELRAHLTEKLLRQLMEVADEAPRPTHMA